MNVLEITGLALSGIVGVCGVVGSWYISSKDNHCRKKGFFIWMVSNPLNATVMLGVMFGAWGSFPLIIPIFTQIYFFYTSYRGWKSNCGESI